MDKPPKFIPTKTEQLGCREGWIKRSLAQSKGGLSNALVRVGIGDNVAKTLAATTENRDAQKIVDYGILMKSDLESSPAPRREAGHEPLSLWFQVDGILRDLIESGHSLRIGFKSALGHDEVGELGGNVHVG